MSCFWGFELGQAFWKATWQFLPSLMMCIPSDPAILHLVAYSKEIIKPVLKELGMGILPIVLATI